MNLTTIEEEIRQVISQIENWQKQGQIPSIEKGIVMSRLQKVYDLLMENKANNEQPAPSEELSTDMENAMSAVSEIEATPNDENFTDEEDVEATDDDSDKDISGISIAVFEVFGEEVLSERHEEFINRLFKGDADYFTSELDRLQSMDSLNDALIYIGKEYDWHPDDSTANHFIELMVEKFS